MVSDMLAERWRRVSLVVVLGCGCTAKQDGATGGSTGPFVTGETTGTAGVSTGSGPGENTSSTDSPTHGSTGSSTTGDTVATSTGDTTPSCPGGTKLVQSQAEGFASGLEACPGAGVHRDAAAACQVLPAVSACEPGACAGGCDDFLPGVCDESSPGDCACVYPCSVDADCGLQAACLCGTSDDFIFGTGCRPASCLTDADCGAFTCGVSPSICRTGEALHCRTAEDECHGDDDCQPGGDRCAFEAKLNHWACSTYAICAIAGIVTTPAIAQTTRTHS